MRKVIFIILLLPIFMWGQTTVAICNGDSIYLYNNWETQNGIYTNGITTTTLIVNPTPIVTGSFILNGNATQTIANTYQLTQAAGNQSGSAWNSVTLNLTQPFSFDVDMFFGSNDFGADGIAFLLQQVNTNVGGSGGGIGYEGISPSFGVEFDTYQNGNRADPSFDHIAIQQDGDLNHNGANNLVPFLGFPPGNSNIEDGLWHNVLFSWDPSTYNFKVVYDGVTLVNYTNNIVASIFGNNPNVYWGFTAATGGANNLQQFRVNSLGVQLSNITICRDDSVQIDPQINTSAYTYLWTPNYNISNNTIASPYFSPDTTTTYTLAITNSYGCTYIDSLMVNVDTSSIITFPLIDEFCLGSAAINLNSATPIGGNYLVNNSASTIFNPTLNDIGVNTITYSYTNSSGCSNSLTNNITVYDLPSVLCLPDSVSCNGLTDGSATLTISGGTPNYTTNWGGYNPTALSAGTYNYTVTDLNSCAFSDNITIFEPIAIQIIIDTFRVSCYGGNDGSATLTILGGAGSPYNINWGGLNSNSLPAGNHIVIVSDGNNCSLTDTAFITQPSDIQIITITNDVSCVGDINGNASLQISGGIAPYSQTWFGIDSSFLAPGTYPYQVVDNNDCPKDGNVTIYDKDTLRASASIVDVDCYGYDNGTINLNITGGTSPYTSDFGVFNPFALESGTYSFTVTDINGCTFDSIATVSQANQIFLDFIAISPICRHDESVLSIDISNSTSNTYTISLQDSVLKSFVIDTNGLLIPEGLPITLAPNFSGEVVIISLTDNNGCTGIFNDDVHIEVKQLPALYLNEDDICVGESSFTLNQATPYGGTYFINDEMTNYFDVENLETGDYNIRYEYTDLITSCYNEIEEIITIIESPEAGLFFSPQPTDMNNPNIFFRDNSNDILTSVWNLGDGTIIYDELSFWHTYSNIGTYIIKYYITNQYNCTDSIIENLVINPVFNTYVPTAFTPDNDENNDYFHPSIIGENNYNMKIYDRWGGIIYNEDNGKWDGTQNGKMVSNGLYSYSILVYDFKNKPFIYTGLVTLIK